MSHPRDKYGYPVPRTCTCKNKECRTKWNIDWEENMNCPKCGLVHCPDCLKGVTKEQLHTHSYRSGLEVTIYETNCPYCGWTIFEYEH